MAKDTAQVYEVMVDTWGANPQFERGDLIKAGDCPYDMESALARGVVREAEYRMGQPITSIGVATNPDGTPDEGLQASVRQMAGIVDPEIQLRAVENELAMLDTHRDSLEQRREQLQEQVKRDPLGKTKDERNADHAERDADREADRAAKAQANAAYRAELDAWKEGGKSGPRPKRPKLADEMED